MVSPDPTSATGTVEKKSCCRRYHMLQIDRSIYAQTYKKFGTKPGSAEQKPAASQLGQVLVGKRENMPV